MSDEVDKDLPSQPVKSNSSIAQHARQHQGERPVSGGLATNFGTQMRQSSGHGMSTNFVLGNRRKPVGSEGEDAGDGTMMTMIGRRSSRVLESEDIKAGLAEEKETAGDELQIKAGIELKIDEDSAKPAELSPEKEKKEEKDRKGYRRRSLGRPSSSTIMAGELDKERERVEKEKQREKESRRDAVLVKITQKELSSSEEKEQSAEASSAVTSDGTEGAADTNNTGNLSNSGSIASSGDEAVPMRLGQSGKKKSASRMVVTQPQVIPNLKKQRADSDNLQGTSADRLAEARDLVAESPQRQRCVRVFCSRVPFFSPLPFSRSCFLSSNFKARLCLLSPTRRCP